MGECADFCVGPVLDRMRDDHPPDRRLAELTRLAESRLLEGFGVHEDTRSALLFEVYHVTQTA